MGKTKRDTGSATEASFHKHYAAIWGEERWQKTLYPALAQPTRYAALVNRYAPLSEFEASIEAAGIRPDGLKALQLPPSGPEPSGATVVGHCIAKVFQPRDEVDNSISTFPTPRRADAHGPGRQLLTHWNLDAASVLVASLMDCRQGDNVLDLCAAPGGKSICLAQGLFHDHFVSHRPAGPRRTSDCLHSAFIPEISAGMHAYAKNDSNVEKARLGEQAGCLHANESDSNRSHRLKENLQAYLPASLVSEGYVRCLNFDGTHVSAHQQLPLHSRYDKVLVDAPCSSERHIIHAHSKAKESGHVAPEMANWRPGSSKRLQETQVKLLMTALKAVRLGGTVVYATCSLEPGENDGVIEKVLALNEKERTKGLTMWALKIGFNSGDGDKRLEKHLEMNWAERTKHGWIVLPDHPSRGRWGPLFFVVLTKVSSPPD